jgi:hypothetical protein
MSYFRRITTDLSLFLLWTFATKMVAPNKVAMVFSAAMACWYAGLYVYDMAFNREDR